MIISYWQCHYQNYEEYVCDDEDEPYIRCYICTHPNNKDKICDLDNKWGRDKADCKLLDQCVPLIGLIKDKT